MKNKKRSIVFISIFVTLMLLLVILGNLNITGDVGNLLLFSLSILTVLVWYIFEHIDEIKKFFNKN